MNLAQAIQINMVMLVVLLLAFSVVAANHTVEEPPDTSTTDPAPADTTAPAETTAETTPEDTTTSANTTEQPAQVPTSQNTSQAFSATPTNETAQSSPEETANQSAPENITQEPANTTKQPSDQTVNQTETINQSDTSNQTSQNTTNQTVPETTSPEPTVEEQTVILEQPTLLQTFLSLLLEKLSFLKGELVKIQANLTHKNSSPVAGEPVDFYANKQKISTISTDAAGLAELFWNTSTVAPGVYLINASYSGDAVLQSSSDAAQVTILAGNETATVETIAANQTVSATAGPVQKIEQCADVVWEEEEEFWEMCPIQRVHKVCSDEPLNKTCEVTTEEYNITCRTSTRVVQKSRQECTTTGFIIDNGVRTVQLNTEQFGCTTEEEGTKITVICDSRFDGNGDGICSSGESCIKFVIDGEYIMKYEKNSRDDYVAEDESFFLERPSKEVLK